MFEEQKKNLFMFFNTPGVKMTKIYYFRDFLTCVFEFFLTQWYTSYYAILEDNFMVFVIFWD